jgi:hypothetical protein
LRASTTDQKNEARKRMKELLPKKRVTKYEPWKESNNFTYEFDNVKPLKGSALTNTEIVRV